MHQKELKTIYSRTEKSCVPAILYPLGTARVETMGHLLLTQAPGVLHGLIEDWKQQVWLVCTTFGDTIRQM